MEIELDIKTVVYQGCEVVNHAVFVEVNIEGTIIFDVKIQPTGMASHNHLVEMFLMFSNIDIRKKKGYSFSTNKCTDASPIWIDATFLSNKHPVPSMCPCMLQSWFLPRNQQKFGLFIVYDLCILKNEELLSYTNCPLPRKSFCKVPRNHKTNINRHGPWNV